MSFCIQVKNNSAADAGELTLSATAVSVAMISFERGPSVKPKTILEMTFREIFWVSSRIGRGSPFGRDSIESFGQIARFAEAYALSRFTGEKQGVMSWRLAFVLLAAEHDC